MTSTLKSPLSHITALIDRTGMYRTVTLALVFLVACSLVGSVVGWVPYTLSELLLSLLIVLMVGLVSNWLLALVFRVHTNHESALITSLIIFFLVIPAQLSNVSLSFIIALVTVLAMVSKYVLVWRKQHILNPVATGAVATAVVYAMYPLPPGYFETAWWIGQPALFVPLALAGVVVVHKVRKWVPVLSFLGVAFIWYLYEEWRFTGELLVGWERFWLSGPSLFLACFMLTEPFTMPPTKKVQAGYGALVGFLSQTTLFLPAIKMTPELALVLGNLAVCPFRLRRKLFLRLKERQQIADGIYEYIFEKPPGLHFEAGQYLEWMLPHRQSDSRGERRYFTIASAPTEDSVRLAVKIVSGGSSYKQQLMQLDIGETIIASQLAGDFLLPKVAGAKIGMIAGGIGITPFRSHIRSMIDTGKTHDTVLFYCANTMSEVAYQPEFAAARASMGLSVIPVIAKEEAGETHETGYFSSEILERRTPDFRERIWYISGPPPMVNACKAALTKLGIPKNQIHTDFFPGLA